MPNDQTNRDGLQQWQQAAYQQQLVQPPFAQYVGMPPLSQGAYQISLNQLGQAQWRQVWDLRTPEQIEASQQAIAKMVRERAGEPPTPPKEPIDYLSITRDIAYSV